MASRNKGKGVRRVQLFKMFALGCILYSGASIYANHLALTYVALGSEEAQKSEAKHGDDFDPSAGELLNLTLSEEQNLADRKRWAENAVIEKEVRKRISDASRPDIVWLMSYPNSGTSYTMRMVTEDSNHTVATNYPNEPKHCGYESVPIYRSSNVPFFLHPNMSMPSKYILTKTHCGGHCLHCEPQNFAELEINSFLSNCSSSKSEEIGNYDDSANRRVKKAVHLMRDPIDNAVSNFHHLLKQFKRDNHPGLLKLFPNNKEGFRQFCELQDHKWQHYEKKIFGTDFKQMKHVKCHGTFYKWVQWHNLVFEITHHKLKIPTLSLWYEDYATDFNKMKTTLFDFLELENVQEQLPFEDGKTYADYFTLKERRDIIDMIQHFAKPGVWELAKRYDV